MLSGDEEEGGIVFHFHDIISTIPDLSRTLYLSLY